MTLSRTVSEIIYVEN